MFGDSKFVWRIALAAAIVAVGINISIGAAPVVLQTPPGVTSVWRARAEARQGDNGAGEVYVNDVLVIRLRTTSGSFGPIRRAEIAAERLNIAIAGGLTAGDVVADTRTDPVTPRLKGAGQIIASADKTEARVSGSSPTAVVRGWASALRSALAIRGLAASDGDILVPLGETRSLRLSGAARGTLTIGSVSGAATLPGEAPVGGDTPEPELTPRPNPVVALSNDTGNENVLTLRGLAAGRETLTFEREGAIASVVVRVQPYAGRFNTPKPVIVTGRGVAIERVARYATAAALRSATMTPGGIARVQTDSVSVAMPLAPGAQSTVTVPVTLSGPDMIGVSRTVSVPLRNESLSAVLTDNLMYSNDPERVTRFGTLFTARIPIISPTTPSATRLLFHHQSALSQTAWFTVELMNDSNAPSTVQIVGGGSGPVRDTVWVGFRAGSDFVRDYLADAGLIVEIPAKSRIALLSTRLPAGTTVSGLMQIRPLSGSLPLVRVSADQVGDVRTQSEAWQPSPLLPNEFAAGGTTLAYPLSEHIYPQPIKRITARYEIGGNWAFVGLGGDPLEATQNMDKKLYGNYGVWYEITATVHNPTDKRTKARAVFVPSAGLAGGVFLVDGKYVEVPQTNLPKEPTLASYTLEPGETRTIKITTLPLSGSNYPARIVIRP
ncbi:MAG: hypothetical protein H7145_07650 [Akkermansiaceae bacterium]|nr:hypothetical protein [Armatimonadota bacterium]